MAKLFKIDEINFIPISIEEAWKFFSNPINLQKITPPSLKLEITSEVPESIYPGMIITYSLNPFNGIRVRWLTEITHVVERERFIDEQRTGPYRFWHHQHFFKEISEGVEMRDIIHYALTFGPLGVIAHALLVRKQLKEIFSFRRSSIEKIFGKYTVK